MEIKRCPTGVEGLDELLEGGFPQGRTILVAGGCGTGKSILATQFLYNGAKKYGEPGVLVSLEQNPYRIKADMKNMGMDLEELEQDNKLIIVDASLSDSLFRQGTSEYTLSKSASFSLESILGIIEDAVRKIDAKRAVIDSFSALDSLIGIKKSHTPSLMSDDPRKTIIGINYKLQNMNLTSILLSDILENEATSKYGVEEFIVDGVITLHYNVFGPDPGRHLVIKKMRSTEHGQNINTIEFNKGRGIRVKGF
jgi:KaiC/GvpD/RAD55 family RecA-like ATPase